MECWSCPSWAFEWGAADLARAVAQEIGDGAIARPLGVTRRDSVEAFVGEVEAALGPIAVCAAAKRMAARVDFFQANVCRFLVGRDRLQSSGIGERQAPGPVFANCMEWLGDVGHDRSLVARSAW